MKLEKVLRFVPFYQSSRSLKHVSITGLSMDSRATSPGDMFICMRGVNMDGHRFAADAVKRGAAAVIAEEPLSLNVPVILVNDTTRAAAMTAAAFYRNPSEDLHVTGITGTNGKTSISYLLYDIFQRMKKKTGLIGTIEVDIAGKRRPVKNTTPDALTLHQYFSDMKTAGVEHAVMEVSSHALDQGRVYGCDFDVAVFTNLTRDHLDYHDHFDDYLRAKSLLFAQLGNGYNKQRERFAVINIDSPAAPKFIRSTSQGLLTYGVKGRADVQARDCRLTEKGTFFQMETPIGTIRIESPLMGEFSIYNMLAAAAAAILSGAPLETIQQSFLHTKGVKGRFESIREGQPFGVVVDYAHTPDSLENVLKTAAAVTTGKIILVVGCGGDRDRSKRSVMGGISVQHADHVIFTTDNPRSEDPDQIFADITADLHGNYQIVEDRREALRKAVRSACEGDMILIAGKGHETYQEIKGVRHPFDDSETVREIIREMKEHS
ncbi:UDP-N-acetylmuramoyl-L-alanyl-D-glutamate--2,6-diaminopimelate ligase [Halobacillus kuroshimensis]|uniref:UDP-N-acetylmuramoyl-L-alanyl-D-glutamate--2,6-diaminopimelate ligase n=1 Tax=Halobacillus kuroshimensis TaxID=302481 RepID=A0ABS3DSM7_9BACI|nr:UDP-N-acetylmuramoyl-L-alanyl-D-glutamate--2,6-diaminopimelate ligase [Halobacillus kuroshimensis]MBN8234350.1 UDP-N-acetylmuramoyl-L-alanyl-D-glutamate--2,6-diaminopimelate ligase [Halobacillus kuroshimensis]